MADKKAADRLRVALVVARTGAGYSSWFQVAQASGVSPTTLENWIYGRTQPRLRELAKVADALGVNPAELEAAYEGVAPPEPPLTEALRDLLPELRELVVVLRAQADAEILGQVRAALEARRRADARSRREPPSEPSDESET